VQIQRIVRGITTRKRVAKVLEKQRKNREKGKTRQQNTQPGNELQKFWINREIIGEKGRPGSRTRRKKERRMKIVSKTSSLILEPMALETPTQICEVQTTSAPQNCLPSAWGTRILHPSGDVMDLSVAYLTHDLLSEFYGQRCCEKSNRGM
jgi:hypothetical protein